jgi:hypothetical protein
MTHRRAIGLMSSDGIRPATLLPRREAKRGCKRPFPGSNLGLASQRRAPLTTRPSCWLMAKLSRSCRSRPTRADHCSTGDQPPIGRRRPNVPLVVVSRMASDQSLAGHPSPSARWLPMGRQMATRVLIHPMSSDETSIRLHRIKSDGCLIR